MVENKNFNTALIESGLTMYALAKYSGVPYTTINELHNGKNDINRVPVLTLWKLCAVLEVDPESIINPINYLDGVKGRYKGIDYTWSTGECSQITFEYQGEPVTISAGATYNIPSRLKYYNIFANWMIEDYIADIRREQEMQELVEKVKSNGR